MSDRSDESGRTGPADTEGGAARRYSISSMDSNSSADDEQYQCDEAALAEARDLARRVASRWQGHAVRVIALQQLESELSGLSPRLLDLFWTEPGALPPDAVQALADAEPDPARRQQILARGERLQQTQPFHAAAQPTSSETPNAPPPSPASGPSPSPTGDLSPQPTAAPPPSPVAGPSHASGASGVYDPGPPSYFSVSDSDSSGSAYEDWGSDAEAEEAINTDWSLLGDTGMPLDRRVEALQRMTDHLYGLSPEGREAWAADEAMSVVLETGLNLLALDDESGRMHTSAAAGALGGMLDFLAEYGPVYQQDAVLMQRLRAAAQHPDAISVGLPASVRALTADRPQQRDVRHRPEHVEARQLARRTVGARGEIVALASLLHDEQQPLARRIDALSRLGVHLGNLGDSDFADYAATTFSQDLSAGIAVMHAAADRHRTDVDLSPAAATALARLGERYASQIESDVALSSAQQRELEQLGQSAAGRQVGLAGSFRYRGTTVADADVQQARADATGVLQAQLNTLVRAPAPEQEDASPDGGALEATLQQLDDSRLTVERRTEAAAEVVTLLEGMNADERAQVLRSDGRQLLLGLTGLAEDSGTEAAHAAVARALRILIDAGGMAPDELALLLVGSRDADSTPLAELEDATILQLIRVVAAPGSAAADSAALFKVLVRRMEPALGAADAQAINRAWQRRHQQQASPVVPGQEQGLDPEQAAALLVHLCRPVDEVTRPSQLAAVARMLTSVDAMPARSRARVVLDPDASAALVRLAVNESLRPPANASLPGNGAAIAAMVTHTFQRALTHADDAQVVAAMVGRRGEPSVLQELAPGRGHRNLQPLAALVYQQIAAQRHPALLALPVHNERGRTMPLADLLRTQPNVGVYPHPEATPDPSPRSSPGSAGGTLERLAAQIQRNVQPQRQQQQRVQQSLQQADARAHHRDAQLRAERDQTVATARERLDALCATNRRYRDQTQQQYAQAREHSAQLRAEQRDEAAQARTSTRVRWAAGAAAASLYAGALANHQRRMQALQQAQTRRQMLEPPRPPARPALPAAAVPAHDLRELSGAAVPPALTQGEAAGGPVLQLPAGSTVAQGRVTVPVAFDHDGQRHPGRLDLRLREGAPPPTLVLAAQAEAPPMVDAVTGLPVMRPEQSLASWTPPPSTFSTRDVHQLRSGVALTFNRGEPTQMHLLADSRTFERMQFHYNAGGRLEIRHAPMQAAYVEAPAASLQGAGLRTLGPVPAQRERASAAASLPSSPTPGPSRQRVGAARQRSAPSGHELAARDRQQRLQEAAVAVARSRDPARQGRGGMQR